MVVFRKKGSEWTLYNLPLTSGSGTQEHWRLRGLSHWGRIKLVPKPRTPFPGRRHMLHMGQVRWQVGAIDLTAWWPVVDRAAGIAVLEWVATVLALSNYGERSHILPAFSQPSLMGQSRSNVWPKCSIRDRGLAGARTMTHDSPLRNPQWKCLLLKVDLKALG
jgi:hypothetical protein